jgi:hypothetical protein
LHNEKDGDARIPQWKKPYEAAILELDPTKLQRRISEAHEAILNRVEELLPRPSDSELHALNDALQNLRILRKMCEANVLAALVSTPSAEVEGPSKLTFLSSKLVTSGIQQKLY